MTEKSSTQLSPQQTDVWIREQFDRANKHLAENGVLFDTVAADECRYLAPFFAIWKIKALDKRYYWVLSGDLPVDFTIFENAPNARDALKYFAMTWQLRAEQIRMTGTQDATQLRFANLLQVRAESLFSLHDNEGMWQK